MPPAPRARASGRPHSFRPVRDQRGRADQQHVQVAARIPVTTSRRPVQAGVDRLHRPRTHLGAQQRDHLGAGPTSATSAGTARWSRLSRHTSADPAGTYGCPDSANLTRPARIRGGRRCGDHVGRRVGPGPQRPAAGLAATPSVPVSGGVGVMQYSLLACLPPWPCQLELARCDGLGQIRLSWPPPGAVRAHRQASRPRGGPEASPEVGRVVVTR